MTKLVEDTNGKIRDLPIQDSLRELLIAAATRAGIDIVRVTSGGQVAKGTPGKRIGSTRHDLGRAADLELWNGNRALSFVRPDDLPFFKCFVTEATILGATGIGAGVDYMGPMTLHVGFGVEAFWGRNGRSEFAPAWLRDAVLAGRSNATDRPPAPKPSIPSQSASPSIEFIVVARSGLNLRGGPGMDYPAIAALPAGSRVWCDSESNAGEWTKVDVDNNGLFDGFVARAYLTRVDS